MRLMRLKDSKPSGPLKQSREKEKVKEENS